MIFSPRIALIRLATARRLTFAACRTSLGLPIIPAARLVPTRAPPARPLFSWQMLEEADTDRSGGLDRTEFHNLIRKMRMMENRNPGPEPSYKAPPQDGLVFSGPAVARPAPTHPAPGVAVLPPSTFHGSG